MLEQTSCDTIKTSENRASQQKPQAELTTTKFRVRCMRFQQETSSEGSTDDATTLKIDPVSVEGFKESICLVFELWNTGWLLNLKLENSAEVGVLPL